MDLAIAADGRSAASKLGDVQGRAFIYDAENVLRQVEDGSSTAIAAYDYYADGTRAEKTVGSVVSSFYYDADQEIAEYDGATLLRRYLRLPGRIDEPFLMIDYTRSGSCTVNDYSDCEVWAHQDRLGSVIAVSDDAGAVMESFTYSPYGVAGGSSSGFPFRCTGQKLDPETGLYYYKARYYDPETGRFLQTAPIGYADQMSLYAYVGNDPINQVDPDGEYAQAAVVTVG